jgi:hypothetical protein
VNLRSRAWAPAIEEEKALKLDTASILADAALDGAARSKLVLVNS